MRGSVAGLLLSLLPGHLHAQVLAPRTSTDDVTRAIGQLASRDSRIWSSAMDALTAAGVDAVPALETCLQKTPDPSADEALRAIRVLQRIGAPAAGTIPTLLVLLARREPRDRATKALVLALAELSPYAPAQRRAIHESMLTLLERERPDAMRQMLQLADLDDKCRTLARCQAGPETPEADLARLLADDNPFAREYAAQLLAAREAAAASTIAALAQAVRGPHPDRFQLEGFPRFELCLDRRIQVAAARAMVRLAPRDARSAAAFALLLDRPEPADRLAAVTAARELGTDGGPVVEELMRMCTQDSALLRGEAITTLGLLGTAAARAAKLLEELGQDPDPQIAGRARAALRQVQEAVRRSGR